MRGRLHSIETFGTVDGPGIRIVVFLQGCGLRCKYCHNPDTWQQNAGRQVWADDLVRDVVRYSSFIKDRGGVTVSGGEPLMQIEFVTEFLKLLKQYGLHTAVDTSGFTFDINDTEKFDELIKFCDLFLLDIKHIDDEQHKKLTGRSNKNTLDFAKYLSENGKKMWIRHVLVPHITDKDEYLRALSDFIATLKTVEKIEVLPYHTMGVEKYEKMGLFYPLKDAVPPTSERVANAVKILERIED